jgi:hypothetical protein
LRRARPLKGFDCKHLPVFANSARMFRLSVARTEKLTQWQDTDY